ncbi:hypothetical protein [Alteromonas sp. AMM-1]|uniref:hypothetical protein n=1 Tax=Alteromonas sp. AMM-1 TaxID=3394233 RepID=UPI0039A60396
MLEHVHPDYEPEDLLAYDCANESPLFSELVNSLAEDMSCPSTTNSKTWLGTLLIAGKECQVQLVVTSDEMIDEG